MLVTGNGKGLYCITTTQHGSLQALMYLSLQVSDVSNVTVKIMSGRRRRQKRGLQNLELHHQSIFSFVSSSLLLQERFLLLKTC